MHFKDSLQSSSYFSTRRASGTIERPQWNVSKILNLIANDSQTFLPTYSNNIDLVIFVRYYHGNVAELCKMVSNVDASTHISGLKNVLIIGVLTDIFMKIKTLNHALKCVTSHVTSTKEQKVTVQLISFPDILYKVFGKLLQYHLCTRRAIELMDVEINYIMRFCGVNSPLHYLLNDLALFHMFGKLPIPTKTWVMVTNADNYYYASYFRALFMINEEDYDIFFSKMIHKGNAQEVELVEGKIDLGSGSMRVEFLRRNNITFLGSLPPVVRAMQYHNADGWLYSKLKNLNVSSLVSSKILYIHN